MSTLIARYVDSLSLSIFDSRYQFLDCSIVLNYGNVVIFFKVG